MGLGIASVAAITVLAYMAGLFWKTSSALDDKWIPCICGVVGGILGAVAYAIKMPDFPASDVINATAIGVVSGLAATGINQLYKQFKKSKVSDVQESEDSEEESPDEGEDTTEN